MSCYSVALRLDDDPQEFVNSFGGDSYDDDESDVEDELEALAGSPPGSPDWKRYIGSFDRPESRANCGRHTSMSVKTRSIAWVTCWRCASRYMGKNTPGIRPEHIFTAGWMVWAIGIAP